MDDLLYAPRGHPDVPGAVQLDAEGCWADLAGGGRQTGVPRDPADPLAAAAAGLWAVVAAEAPERAAGTGPGEDWERVAYPLRRAGPLALAGGDGPLTAMLAASLSDRAEGGAAVVPVDPPPDGPVRMLDLAELRRWIAAALLDLERRAAPQMVVVTTSELVTGRPLGGAAAAVAGAATAWALARGAAVLHLGPWSAVPGPRRLGFAPLGPDAVRGAVRAAASGGFGRLLALDVAWGEAIAAFPHLRALGSAFVGRVSEREVVAEEVARIARLGAPSPTRALRELGLDSAMLEELRGRLQERLGRPVPSAALFEHSTIEALGRWLQCTAPRG